MAPASEKSNGMPKPKAGARPKQAVRRLPAQRFEIVVECAGEAQQRELYEELTARGWKCRVLTF
jgi:hypothetical protein